MEKQKPPYFNDEFIQQVCDHLLQQIAIDVNNNLENDKFDQMDIDRLKSGDNWFIRRFLVEKPNTTILVAAKKMREALIWRKSIGINQL